jgi:SAM-dependent methyltransferase
MSSTLEHYEKHLAPVYSWMAGGIEDAITRGQKELTDIGLLNRNLKYAVDLGAGFGMHSIPLARTGCTVLAIDSSAFLLQELKSQAKGAAIAIVQDDLLSFARHLTGEPEIVLCMGDTLTHLPEKSSITNVIAAVSEHLRPGGLFVITFRDYSTALEGASRFIPVKGDESRILTCFLEYAEDTVEVHDILHEFKDGAWSMRVSAYRKLRVDPSWVKEQLEKRGFAVDVASGLSGMVRFRATRLSRRR